MLIVFNKSQHYNAQYSLCFLKFGQINNLNLFNLTIKRLKSVNKTTPT